MFVYGRYDKKSIEERKTLIWRNFIIYWTSKKIYSVNDGLSPMVKRNLYYDSIEQAAEHEQVITMKD